MPLSQLITNDQGMSISNKLDQLKGTISPVKPLLSKDVALHNSIYRGKNLTGIYTLYDIHNMIKYGDFSDLYIGDYITIKKPYTSNGNTYYYYLDIVIAAFDWYLGIGPGQLGDNIGSNQNFSYCDNIQKSHHVVFVTGNVIKWIDVDFIFDSYDSPTGLNGYIDTEIFREYGSANSNKLYGNNSIFGDTEINNDIKFDRIVPKYSLLTNSINENGSNGYSWYAEVLGFLTEVELYGRSIYSSSLYDNGETYSQLPLFRLNPNEILLHKNWIENRNNFGNNEYESIRDDNFAIYYLRNIAKVTKRTSQYSDEYKSVHFCTCGQYNNDNYHNFYSDRKRYMTFGTPGYDIYGQDFEYSDSRTIKTVNKFDIRLKFILSAVN